MKKKRLFMNLKKKLAVFMSLSSLLNTATIKGANDINCDRSSKNFDYEENDDNLSESLKLPPIDWLSEILKIDPLVAGFAGILLSASVGKKIYDNSLVVPTTLPKQEKKLKAAPVAAEVENQIEWSNSLSWADLVKKSQDLWEQQGYEFKRENNPQNMTIKAKLKSNETYYNKPFHIPKGIFGPIYAVQESKIKEVCNNNKEITKNVNSLRKGKVPLCDCDGLLVNSRMELTQILVAMLKNLQDYMNKQKPIEDIKAYADKKDKSLSLGDILYVFNKLVEKLIEDGHKSPVNTASWFFFGATSKNQYQPLGKGLASCMQLVTNLLPILGLYGMQVPGRYRYQETWPTLGYFIQFYNEQCKWDFTIPIRSEKGEGNEVSYQIGNTNVTLNKESNDMKCAPVVPINVDGLNVLRTDLAGCGTKNKIVVGVANGFMNTFKKILGMGNVKDFVAVFATRLAVYTSRLEPLIKFIECLDNMYQESKGNIESLLMNVEKLTAENKSIEAAKEIIKEYSLESEKGSILRRLLGLFKRNFEDSDLDAMLNSANYFEKDLPTVFQEYDEKAVKQKENDYIKELNEKKNKLDADRELSYCSLKELGDRLNKVTKDSKEEYQMYYELAKRCVSSGRANGETLAYIYNKYNGYIKADYPKAIKALKRLIIRSLSLYPWKDSKPIYNRLNQDANTTTDELASLQRQVNDNKCNNDWNEYKSLKNLTEFYVEEGAIDTKILEPINFIEKRYIGNTGYTSDYPKLINALKHILKHYYDEHKCKELNFIQCDYDGTGKLKELEEEVTKQKGKNNYYEYQALDSLTEFYALEGLLEPQILNRLNFIKKKYIDSAWFQGDYNSAVQAVKCLIRRNYDIYKWEELKFIKDQYNTKDEFKKLKDEIQESTGKNNCDEYKSLEKLAEFYVLEGLLEPEISETLEFIRGKYIKDKWVWGDYSGAIKAITRLLKRHINMDEEPGSLIKDRYGEQSAKNELKMLKDQVDKSNKENWRNYYKYTSLKNLAEFYIEEGLLEPKILDKANKEISKGYLHNGYSEAIEFFQDELKKVKYD